MKQFAKFSLIVLLITIPLTSFRSVNTVAAFAPQTPKITTPTETVYSDLLDVKVTFYNPVFSQCDDTPLITASGATIDTTKTTSLHWCAISFNLHKNWGGPFSYGDVIEIEGFNGKNKIKGRYIVHDLMNPKLKNRIDILYGIGEQGHNFDSATVKHEKIKKHKAKLAEQAKEKANRLKIQLLHETIRKSLNGIPFIGTDVLKKEHYTKKFIPRETKIVSLNEKEELI